jgi:predicted RNA-binding protein (virulence factor B family)
MVELKEKEKIRVKRVGEHRVGDVCDMHVVRVNESVGAFLDAGTGDTADDILLHKLQQTTKVKVGDIVKVYLYLDPSGRMTASQKLPKMREGQVGYVKVLSVNRNGGFVDIGAERGVFLPYSEMRGHVSPNQLVWAKLYRDKTGRLAVSMRVEEEMVRASKPATGVKIGDMVTGTIYNILPEGFFILTKQRFIAFLHRSELATSDKLDFGQEITGRITFIREDGNLNISMKKQKEIAIVEDGKLILNTLRNRNGAMPYDDNTPADVIKEKFQISKGAFKRAIGHLMREGYVTQEDGWTTLIKDVAEETTEIGEEDSAKEDLVKEEE